MSVIYVACSIFDRPEHRFEETLRLAQQSSKHTFFTNRAGGLSPGSQEKFMGLCALRNSLMSTFLGYKQCDYFCLVDSDLVFYDNTAESNIFDKMIEWDKDFVVGLYAPRVQIAGQLHTSCPRNVQDMQPTFGKKLVPLRWAAGGCWMIKRSAIEAVRDSINADLSYEEGGRPFWGFFNEMIVELSTADGGTRRKFLSEDYSFCERFNRIGKEIWADTSIMLGHIGPHEYRIWRTPPHLGGNMGICNTDRGALRYLVDRFGVKTMLDIGCGLGKMRDVAQQEGVSWRGVDGDPCLDVPDMDRHDFTTGTYMAYPRADLAWCVEMVEHLDETYLQNLLDTFWQHAIVCMTHALPGQGGHHHVNCQPPEYWISRMEEGGWFVYDAEATAGVRSASTMQADYMRKTGLVFVRRD